MPEASSQRWFEAPGRLEPWEEEALRELNWAPRERAREGQYGLVKEAQWELWPLKFAPFRPFSVDFLDPSFLRRLKTFGTGSPLIKALGRSAERGQTLLDASAGWLGDALLLAKWGLKVSAFERSPAVYLLVRSALERAGENSQFAQLLRGEISYEFGSSAEAEGSWDFVYYDPMYPTKKALSEKSMQILKDVVGEDGDSLETARILKSRAKERLVVKRPPKGEWLWKPDYSIASKTVRYDIYL